MNRQHGEEERCAWRPVKLPNGGTVQDSHSPNGLFMSPVSDLSDVAHAGKGLKAANRLASGGDNPGSSVIIQLYVTLRQDLAHTGTSITSASP